jgi:ubiquinone/menaquinone biosynthesis C-methylase UbiE
MHERWDDGQVATNEYRARLAELVEPGMKILHAGCGWDKNQISGQFKNNCTVIGIDLDPRVETLFHSEFYLASLDSVPLPANTFDVIISEYVFEHLSDPDAALAEFKRLLKPSGTIVILTPNAYSYKTLAARMTPQSFHVLMGRHRYGRGHEADMYPTLFRCNVENKFRKIAGRVGLKVSAVRFVTNGPTWFAKLPVIFELFHVFHLSIKRWGAARRLRCALMVELKHQ